MMSMVRCPRQRDIGEHDDAERGGENHGPAGDKLGGPVADQAPAQAGDDRP